MTTMNYSVSGKSLVGTIVRNVRLELLTVLGNIIIIIIIVIIIVVVIVAVVVVVVVKMSTTLKHIVSRCSSKILLISCKRVRVYNLGNSLT